MILQSKELTNIQPNFADRCHFSTIGPTGSMLDSFNNQQTRLWYYSNYGAVDISVELDVCLQAMHFSDWNISNRPFIKLQKLNFLT